VAEGGAEATWTGEEIETLAADCKELETVDAGLSDLQLVVRRKAEMSSTAEKSREINIGYFP
jgi:hypothetical protein